MTRLPTIKYTHTEAAEQISAAVECVSRTKRGRSILLTIRSLFDSDDLARLSPAAQSSLVTLIIHGIHDRSPRIKRQILDRLKGPL